MVLPRAHSDPGGQRHEAGWAPVHSPSPMIQYPPPLRYPQSNLHHEPIIPLNVQSPPSLAASTPQPQMISLGVNTDVVGEPVIPHPARRPLWLTIVLAPYLAIEYILKSWCSPSPECMRCVQISYWMVIMVSGMITLVLAMSPKK